MHLSLAKEISLHTYICLHLYLYVIYMCVCVLCMYLREREIFKNLVLRICLHNCGGGKLKICRAGQQPGNLIGADTIVLKQIFVSRKSVFALQALN